MCEERLEMIENYAFANCVKLDRIEITSADTVIMSKAFDGCSTDMVIKAPNPSLARTFALENGFQYEEY